MTTIAAGELVTEQQINQWAPPGMLIPFAGTTVPAGWLLCDGASYLRADYPDLFAAIGTTYGAADGTHFNVPDLRGRVIVGHAASGGHADAATLGGNDGVAAANRTPKHNTSISPNPHAHAIPVYNATGGLNVIPAGSGSPTGGTAPANGTLLQAGPGGTLPIDTPAYIVLEYLIRAKDV